MDKHKLGLLERMAEKAEAKKGRILFTFDTKSADEAREFVSMVDEFLSDKDACVMEPHSGDDGTIIHSKWNQDWSFTVYDRSASDRSRDELAKENAELRLAAQRAN